MKKISIAILTNGDVQMAAQRINVGSEQVVGDVLFCFITVRDHQNSFTLETI